MKIKNEGIAFKVIYDSKEYDIPNGDMEIADDGFATFIAKKARQWGINVVKTAPSIRKAVEPIEPIKPVEEVKEEVVEEIVEEVVDEVTEEVKEKKDKKAKK